MIDTIGWIITVNCVIVCVTIYLQAKLYCDTEMHRTEHMYDSDTADCIAENREEI